jgi:hypothetical protein
MYMKHNIGRNDPCPCGSGKKYKHCHGAISSSMQPTSRQKPDSFVISKEIAYKGNIGRQRRSFCLEYMAEKKANLEYLQTSLKKKIEDEGKTITCKEGCSFCCALYVEANPQECELIVYYLYQHDNILSGYLGRYPSWRNKIKQNGDLHKRCGSYWNKDLKGMKREGVLEIREGCIKENERYRLQDLPCPFLVNNLCSIYEVRPYTCAVYVSTSPPQWCDIASQKKPALRNVMSPEIMFDRSFYYKKLETPVVTCMPIAVYEILKSGPSYYSAGPLPGFKNLDLEFYSDPEVVPILRRHGVLGR